MTVWHRKFWHKCETNKEASSKPQNTIGVIHTVNEIHDNEWTIKYLWATDPQHQYFMTWEHLLSSAERSEPICLFPVYNNIWRPGIQTHQSTIFLRNKWPNVARAQFHNEPKIFFTPQVELSFHFHFPVEPRGTAEERVKQITAESWLRNCSKKLLWSP